jgi:hypothetical protein
MKKNIDQELELIKKKRNLKKKTRISAFEKWYKETWGFDFNSKSDYIPAWIKNAFEAGYREGKKNE